MKKLRKEHLVEIKSLGSPPQALQLWINLYLIIPFIQFLIVKTTLSGLVILCEKVIIGRGGEIFIDAQTKEPNYFDTAKIYLLNDPKDLLELLNTFDKHSID